MSAAPLAGRDVARSRPGSSRPPRIGRCVVAWVAVLAIAAAPARGDIVFEEFEPLLRLDLPGHTGEVRALEFSADSSRLISGGRDKVGLVWQLGQPADAAPAARLRDMVLRQRRERAIRWQIARGPRGWIQCIAASPRGDPPVIAIAGYGAMGSTGEIVLVDARDGSWVQTLGGATADNAERTGHRQNVSSLQFTADGSWLLSQDLDGQAFAWKRAENWRPFPLAAREEERFGAAGAQALRGMPPVRPLVSLGDDRVAIPTLMSRPDATPPLWKIRITNLARPDEPARLLSLEHRGVVMALAATPDGKRLVTADYSGMVAMVDPVGGQPPVVWELKTGDERRLAETLAITPDGKRVAIGLAGALADGGAGLPPRLEIWEAAPPRMIATRTVAAPIRALRVSPDGRWLAWSGAVDHAVFLESVATLGKPEAEVPADVRRKLGGVGQQITRVAFSSTAADARRRAQPAGAGPDAPRRTRDIVLAQKPPAAAAGGMAPPSRIAIARRGMPGAQPPPPFDAAFDIEGLAVAPAGNENDWAPAAGRPAGWAIRPDSRPDAARPPGIERWELLRAGRPAGVIDLVLDWQGRAGGAGAAISWLTKGADEPWAIAMGTSFGIFIYRLEAEAGVSCRLVRRFRGNEDRVLSLAVSEDGRWLASGGGDGITMIWSLSGIDGEVPLTERWGVSLKVQNGRAVVDAIDEAGPLAGRDVRVGDTIAQIAFKGGRTVARTEHVAGDAIRTTLAGVPWETSVVFTVERDADGRRFNRIPAWENIAALHLATDNEWSFWTPRGYYAASANGDQTFGWIVNRGIDQLPRFFRANQFRRRLERPDVVSQLLVAGSLDAALRAAGRDVPEAAGAVLPGQIRQTPEIRILSPTMVDVAQAGRLALQAEILVPEGVVLDRVKAFASGVAASAAPRLVENVAAAAGQQRRQVYQWDIDLPDQEQQLVGVFASTREGPSDAEKVEIKALAPPPRPRKPRLYVVAAGVNRYPKAGAWRALGADLADLRFAIDDAAAVRDALAWRTLEVYDLGTEPRLLADREVTRDGWKAAIMRLVDELKGQVMPDDLIVLFLAGHGMRNVDAEDAYTYLCHDADLRMSKSGRDVVPTASGTIGWADLEPLADLPCRRLALVDTCHSGALGPAARSTSVREFQDNMIVVLAAAEDDQPSAEDDAWGHGAFTKALLEVLGVSGGGASASDDDGRRRFGTGAAALDDVVSLDELIAYVCARVTELEPRQTPKASPRELLGFVRPPIVKIPPAAR